MFAFQQKLPGHLDTPIIKKVIGVKLEVLGDLIKRCIMGAKQNKKLPYGRTDQRTHSAKSAVDWTLHPCNQSRKQRGIMVVRVFGLMMVLSASCGPTCHLRTVLMMPNAYC